MAEIKIWQERMGPHYVYDRALNCAQAEIDELRAALELKTEHEAQCVRNIARLKELLSQALGALNATGLKWPVVVAATSAIEKEGIK